MASSTAITQAPPGRGAVPPALGDPAWAGRWAGGLTEVPAIPDHCVILYLTGYGVDFLWGLRTYKTAERVGW